MRGFRIFLSANDPILSAGASILETLPEVAEAVAAVEPPVAAPQKKRNKKVTKVVKTKKVTKKVVKVKKDGRGRPQHYTDADMKKIGKLVAKLNKDGLGRAAGRAEEILHAKTGKLATLRKEAGFDKPVGTKKDGEFVGISMVWILKANGLYGAELPLGRPKLAA
jgi:hypothetical protein